MAWHYDLVIANLLYNTLSMHQNGCFEGGEVGWITHIIMEVFVYSLIKGLAHVPSMVADAIARSAMPGVKSSARVYSKKNPKE